MIDQANDAGLTVDEVHMMAVAGIAAVKASRELISALVQERVANELEVYEWNKLEQEKDHE